MNSPGHSPPTIQIRLTHSHGRARSGLLIVGRSGIGLADLLQLDGRTLNWKQTREANACRIECSDEGWTLRSASRALVCAVNGIRVKFGNELPIALGDSLEVELLRLVVEGAPRGASTPTSAPAPLPRLDSPGAPNEDIAFDLRDLARPSDSSRQLPTPSHWIADDKGALLSGAIARHPPNPANPAGLDPAAALALLDLAALEIQQHDVTGGLRHATFPLSNTPQSGSEHTPPRPHMPSNAKHRPARIDESNRTLLDDLHGEYHEALRDPEYIRAQGEWHAPQVVVEEAAQDLDGLIFSGSPVLLVRDIVARRAEVAAAIDSIDVLAETQLEPDTEAEVLGLFAPGHLNRNAVRMPELTRREHHTISPDSSVRITPRVHPDENANSASNGEPHHEHD